MLSYLALNFSVEENSVIGGGGGGKIPGLHDLCINRYLLSMGSDILFRKSSIMGLSMSRLGCCTIMSSAVAYII